MKIQNYVVLFMLFAILSACKSSPVSSGLIAPNSSSNPTMNTPSPSVQPILSTESDQLPFRSKLLSISFGESNENGGYAIFDWERNDIPNEPTDVSFHLTDVIFSASYKGLDEKEMQQIISQIQVTDQVEWDAKPNPTFAKGILITFKNAPESFKFQIGDLPTLTFKHQSPLSIAVTSASGDDIPYLILKGQEYGTRLLVPDDRKEVELIFSEEMNKAAITTNEGKNIHSKWKDPKHLLVHLDDLSIGNHADKELVLDLSKLRSISSNYFGTFEQSLKIELKPQYDWFNIQTGKRLATHPRDRFYDQMIMSSDGQSYIGVVFLGYSQGDGAGTSYSFILERSGQEPIVIENVFYSTIEPNDLPVQWIDSNTIMYATYFGVYAYDINQGKKRVLHEVSKDEKNNINFATYDVVNKKLYVLAYDDRYTDNKLGLITYGQGKQAPTLKSNFTETVLINTYHTLAMTILPTTDGIYWTRIKDGLPITEFINHSGTVVTTSGYVRGITENGVYLQRFKKGERNIMSSSWAFWQPGKNEQPIVSPPESSTEFVSGQELIARKDSIYYHYDPKLNKWVKWTAPNGSKYAEPIRGANGLYRVRLD
ncbi:hypothetical protein E0485_04765 [Paenibacillus albiflavus]|uniref:Lipoprotein n=1 Tax=Paenibacillus albiflavus TaxID=2545760 RepID=A0A4R4ENZ6_9BACL|nr:hypothetical protein [Paenibacillus albiflavus]TCZ80165.1 hypothetical protein E0485_04765 [Paenibacillus albiflavus]